MDLNEIIYQLTRLPLEILLNKCRVERVKPFQFWSLSGPKEPKLSKMLFMSSVISWFLFLIPVLSKLGHAEKRLWVRKLHCKLDFYLSFSPVFFAYILLLRLFKISFQMIVSSCVTVARYLFTKTLWIPKMF